MIYGKPFFFLELQRSINKCGCQVSSFSVLVRPHVGCSWSLLWRQAGTAGRVLEKRRLWGDLIVSFQYLKRGYKKTEKFLHG